MKLRVSTLKKSSDFKIVTSKGSKAHSESFLLFYQPSSRTDMYLRIGFTASKKIGGAVQRNLSKRRMKSLSYEVLRFYNLSNYDLVIIAKIGMIKKKYGDIAAEMKLCIKKIFYHETQNDFNV